MQAVQPGQPGRSHGDAVITTPAGDDLLLLGPAQDVVVVPDQLDLGVVGVGTAVAEEHLRHRDRGRLDQSLGQRASTRRWPSKRTSGSRQAGFLRPDGVGHLEVPVADVHAPQAGHGVEVGLPLTVGQTATLAFDDDQRARRFMVANRSERVEGEPQVEVLQGLCAWGRYRWAWASGTRFVERLHWCSLSAAFLRALCERAVRFTNSGEHSISAMMTALAESFVPLVAGHVADLRAAGLLREALFIDGEWVAASDGGTLEVTDPASGESVAHVASATPEDVRRAVAAAERARHGWWARPATERADVLLRWHDLIKDSQEQLALLLTIEEGKPLAEARGEIAYSAAFVRFYAEEARRGYGEVIPGNRSSRRLFALRQPVGVVAAITPWNFPALMIARKAAPAFAAGCGVVLKPPSETPLSGLALAELGARRAPGRHFQRRPR